jgi:polyisoprenoid-binding protein YceI
MKSVALAALALSIVSASGKAQARDTVGIDTRRGSQVWIEGGSNLAVNWRCRATTFEASIELAPGMPSRDEAIAMGLRSIDVRVAVRDLKCGNGKMEKDLYAALNATDASNPSYIIARFNVQPNVVRADSIETHGAVTVAGVERLVTVPVATGRGPDGSMRARGAVALLMTDFGVKPPVGLFGLIRSKNQVTVRFDLVVPPRTLAQR